MSTLISFMFPPPGGDFAVSYNSPSLGTLDSMVIPVNTESANGKIGFLSVDTVYADEPMDGVDYTQVMK